MLHVIPRFKVGRVRFSFERRDEGRRYGEELRPILIDGQIGEEGVRLQARGFDPRRRVEAQESLDAIHGLRRQSFILFGPIHLLGDDVLEDEFWSFVIERWYSGEKFVETDSECPPIGGAVVHDVFAGGGETLKEFGRQIIRRPKKTSFFVFALRSLLSQVRLACGFWGEIVSIFLSIYVSL